MKKFKFLILGAGPSGLALAHSLLMRGETSFIVLEKENVAGGLCRSQEVDGSPLDIGGGHFLDVKRPDVLKLLFSFLPESEWNKYSRISKIQYNGIQMDYPFESHIWQLGVDQQIEFLNSISKSGSNLNLPIPNDFKSWISWKLGSKIAKDYMLPYNRKIWSIDLDLLGTYWLYKLPNVSFEEILRSCLERRITGTLPAHGSFYYPKDSGYGKVWRIMGDKLKDKLLLNFSVKSLDFDNLIINNEFQAENIISTIPWQAIQKVASLPTQINILIDKLEYSSIRVEYIQEEVSSDAHWIYVPNEQTSYHRKLCRSNFVNNSRGYWTECNKRRVLETDNWYHDNEFAYPLNLKNKPETIESILDWFSTRNIKGLGRWGRWEHMNSDVAVQEAINLSKEILRN